MVFNASDAFLVYEISEIRPAIGGVYIATVGQQPQNEMLVRIPKRCGHVLHLAG